MALRAAAILSFLFLATGCAGGVTRGPYGGGTAFRSNVISSQELSEHPELRSVGDAVRRLRPAWREVPIYVGNERYVGTSRDLPLTFVQELRYLDVSEAQMRWGQSISTPILLVTNK